MIRAGSTYSLREIAPEKKSVVDEIQEGRPLRALELLNDGANANQIDRVYGWSALHLAARDGKISLARALLKHGAVVDIRDRVGQTPLHRAAYWGQTEMVTFLVESGSDFTVLDTLMQTPEELARQQGHKELSVHLIQYCEFLKFEGLRHYSKDQITRMLGQIKMKEEEDARRRIFKQELERYQAEAEKENKKMKQVERKIAEKRRNIVEKAEKYKEEIQILANAGVKNGLTKSDVGRLKKLQGKLRGLYSELEEQKVKLNKFKRKSVENLITDAKADGWISFINSV